VPAPKITWTQRLDVAEPPVGVRRLTAADLFVVYQPIVDLATGRTFAQEALVRCRHADYPTPPVLFEHAAREGACGRLGRLIRDIAFDTPEDTTLFVNVHPDELTSRWLVQPDDPVGFQRRPVHLEITETTAVTHHELCMSVLKELCRRTGALLVVDDFGAGYSNLERVVALEPAIVKLDLVLTRNIHKNKTKQVIVRHMVNLCTELGARVVAEGVEELDELSCVRDCGAHYAQGYLLARPAVPAPAVNWPLGPRRTSKSKRPSKGPKPPA
jgi:EAL domain-containing protein (putative c-di-GMP-specific phosphodiesterase class I)